MKKLFLLSLISFLSCGEKKRNQKHKIKSKEATTEINKLNKEEIRYVTAKTGLIYRTKPKGEKLGKLPYDTEVTISKHTGIMQEVKTKEGILEGEWVAIKYKKRNVYVFDGYLGNGSKTKLNLNYEQAQNYLQNGVWVSQEFKRLLEITKLYSEASQYKHSPHNIIFHGKNKVSFWSENLTKETTHKMDKKFRIDNSRPLKIIKLDNSNMTLKYQDFEFNYFKIPLKFDENIDIFEELTKGTDFTLKRWFAGEYILNDEHGENTISFNENSDIRFHAWYSDYQNDILIDVISFNKKLFKILKIEDNTYYLEEIKMFENQTKPEIILTGKKYTLKKLN